MLVIEIMMMEEKMMIEAIFYKIPEDIYWLAIAVNLLSRGMRRYKYL